MTDKYVLDEAGNPIPCEDLFEWATWLDQHRVVKQTEVGAFFVSTVFLGIDHAFGGGPPVLWETMIFRAPDGHPLDGYQERYASQQAAIEGHERAVELARGAAN